MADAWRVPFSQYLARQGIPPEVRRAHLYDVANGVPGEGARHWAAFQRQLAWLATREDLVRKLRLKHLSLRTERSYLGWVDRFASFSGAQPDSVGSPDVERFLSDLAVRGNVSASTQNQAFSALLFLFRHVLDRELVVHALRARESRRLPVVLSREEVAAVVACLPPRFALMARLTYGAGLRLQECLELRIKDLDFDRGILTVRSGKGDKDRPTVLPDALRRDWQEHVRHVRALHERDRQSGLPGVALPMALERKYPGAGKEWA